MIFFHFRPQILLPHLQPVGRLLLLGQCCSAYLLACIIAFAYCHIVCRLILHKQYQMVTAMTTTMGMMMVTAKAMATLMVMSTGLGGRWEVATCGHRLLAVSGRDNNRMMVRWQQQQIGQWRCSNNVTINLHAKDERGKLTTRSWKDVEATREPADDRRWRQQEEEVLVTVIVTVPAPPKDAKEPSPAAKSNASNSASKIDWGPNPSSSQLRMGARRKVLLASGAGSGVEGQVVHQISTKPNPLHP